jgi:hypothetical protein
MDKDVRKKLIRNKLSLFRGTILSDSTEIEGALAWRLRTYFFPKTNRQASLFHYLIVNKLRFEEKIKLYENIPTFQHAKRFMDVKKSLRFVQQLRNALAHWELWEKESNENEIVIMNMVTFRKLKLDDKLMNEFKENDKFLLKVFGWKQTLREKYGSLSEENLNKKLM